MMVIPNMAQVLETGLMVGATPHTPPIPPAPMVTMALPVSYQFQVVEYTNVDGDVVKVELQVQQTCHDQYGGVKSSSGFKPVPRFQLPLPT